jgi:hypothetical protein
MAGIVLTDPNALPGPPVNLPVFPAPAPAAAPAADIPLPRPRPAPPAPPPTMPPPAGGPDDWITPQPMPAAEPSAAPAAAPAATTEAAPPSQSAAASSGPDDWITPGRPATAGPSDQGSANAGLAGLIQGATFGWAPEASGLAGGAEEAVLGALSRATGYELGPAGSQGSFQTGYDRNVAAARDILGSAAANHPYVYGAGQVAGTLATMVPAAGTATGAKALGLAGDTLLGRMGWGAGSNAVLGAVAGAGNAGPGNRASGAGWGAGTGLVLGGAAPAVGAVAGKVIGAGATAADAIKGAVTGTTPWRQAGAILGHGSVEPVTVAVAPHTFAARKLAGMVSADALTPEAAAANPEALLAEHGGNLSQIAGGITAMPGEGQTTLREALTARQAGATDRIQQALDQTLGPERDVLQTADDISKAQAARAAPAYAAVRDTPISPSANLRFVLSTKAGKAAMAKAEGLAEGFGQSIDPEMPTVGALDYVKRAFDDQIGKATRAGANAKAASLSNLRNRLVAEVDKQVPAYAKAREVFAGPAAVKDALEAGQETFSNSVSPASLRRTLRDMTASERAAYAIGARAQIAEIMGTARNDATAAVGTFKKAWNVEKLQTIVGPERAKVLLDALEHERTLQEFATRLKGSAETAARLNAEKALGGKSLLTHTLGTFRFAAAINGFKGIRNVALTRMAEGLFGSHDETRNEQVASIIARGLAKNGPEKVALIRALQAGLDRVSTSERWSTGADLLVRKLIASMGPAGAQVVARYATQPTQ